MHLLGGYGELAVAVHGDDEVDRELRVQLRVVRAVVGPARLPPLDSPEERRLRSDQRAAQVEGVRQVAVALRGGAEDRKSTRLNSSHANISYAVFCLKKKKTTPFT